MNEPIRPLIHNQRTVAQLIMTDELGTVLKSPYKMKKGENVFKSVAVHIDGQSEPYKAIWTCPVMYQNGTFDLYGSYGAHPQDEIRIHAGENIGRYTELVCWAWTPAEITPTGNAEIPHFSIGFDYQDIDS